MSDLQTMRQLILRELHVDPDTSDTGSQVTNDVNIAIIEAIRFNRKYRFPWNERWYTFQTVSNKDRYELPKDFLGLIPDTVFSVPSNDFLHKSKLKSIPIQQANQVQQSSVASIAYREVGAPFAYAIDPGSRSFVVLPIPSSDGDAIEFMYVADVGTPVMKYTGSAWAFYAPPETGVVTTAAETLPATFSNPWFQEAFWLTFCRAMHILLTRTYGGLQGSVEKANQYITQWAEQLNSLRSEARMMRGAFELRKHI